MDMQAPEEVVSWALRTKGHWLGWCNTNWCGAMQVLSIGETVEEVNDSGFLGPVPTLRVQLLVDDSLLQVIESSDKFLATNGCITARSSTHIIAELEGSC